MAETSPNNSNIGSPLVNLSQDHLFSILLKLPIDSVLYFAMTCKRFSSLTNSNFLWESLCKRDWGDGFVNAVKSSNPRRTWRIVYKQLFQLSLVSCRILSDPGVNLPDPDVDLSLPNARASPSLNFVSNCLVLFAGASQGASRLDDTWVAYIGNDFRGALNWRMVSQGIPSRRFGHSCVVSGDYLVLFGGINDGNLYYNDTWVGQVAYCENHGVAFSWRSLDVSSNRPPPRGAHGACCIDNRKMVIHGGKGSDGRLGDAWVLEISEDFSSGLWLEVTTLVSPSARSGHSLTYIGRNQVVLFGGREELSEVLSDLWLLDVSENSFNWVQIHYALRNVPEQFTLDRAGHSGTLVLGGQLLVHGGQDSSGQQYNDFWVLNTKEILSTRLEQGVLFRNVWKRVDIVGHEPICKSIHQACADDSGRYLYVFGGLMIEPTGPRFSGELLLVDLLP